MTRSGALFAAALTLATFPAVAAAKNQEMGTVKGLADFCAAKPGTEKAAACAGYIAGIMSLESLEHADIDAKAAFCPPEEDDALVDGVSKMLAAIQSVARSKPAVQNAPALFGVIAAGRIAFPCPGEKS